MGEPGVVPAWIGIIGRGASTTGDGVGVGVASSSTEIGGVGVVPGSGGGSISIPSEVGVGSLGLLLAAGVGVGVDVGVGVKVALGLTVDSAKPMASVSWPKTGLPFQQRKAAAKNTHAKKRHLSICVISNKADAKRRKFGGPGFIAADSEQQPVQFGRKIRKSVGPHRLRLHL